MTLPNVAIIISNYNYGEFVLDAIDSALGQDYKGPLRVYIVDDGSSDDSWKKINDRFDKLWSPRAFPSSDEIFKPYYKGDLQSFQVSDKNFWAYRIQNSGASTARNFAIWEAWGWADIFAILDADDTYAPNKVSRQVEKLIEYDEVGVTYSDYIIHKTYNSNDYNKYEYKYPYSFIHLNSECIVHSAGLIKKKYLKLVVLPNREFYDSALHGPGSGDFIGCTEDYDLWLRLSRVCIMSHIPEPLSFVRETGKNQSMKMTEAIFAENAEKIRSRNE